MYSEVEKVWLSHGNSSRSSPPFCEENLASELHWSSDTEGTTECRQIPQQAHIKATNSAVHFFG